MELTCRFYEQKSPNIGDVVMVRIHSFPATGPYVHLLEYNNMEGESLEISNLMGSLVT